MFMECILNDSQARFKPFRVAQPNFFDERDEDEVEVEAAGGRRRRSRRSLWDERTGPWTGGFGNGVGKNCRSPPICLCSVFSETLGNSRNPIGPRRGPCNNPLGRRNREQRRIHVPPLLARWIG